MKDKDYIEIKKAEKPYTAAFTLELHVAAVADPQSLGKFEFAHIREAIVASPLGPIIEQGCFGLIFFGRRGHPLFKLPLVKSPMRNTFIT